MYASEFNPASSVLYKDNIEPFSESGMDIVKDHPVFTYFLKSDLNEGIYDNKQIGFIAEAAPMLRKGDTINMYKGLSMNRKATQELITRLEEAEHKIADLEMAVN
ncbi:MULTISPECIES: tail fiber domain-containing protein [Bacillaceae]|uniref:tail fiber domain-containing protein n=1 Tax=Bacillaceae TaxID=186817 RepID=UPI002E1C2734